MIAQMMFVSLKYGVATSNSDNLFLNIFYILAYKDLEASTVLHCLTSVSIYDKGQIILEPQPIAHDLSCL